MNTLNENELRAISGGEIQPLTVPQTSPAITVDPWLQSFFDAQANAANQAITWALTGGMVD